MSNKIIGELLELNQRLLTAISQADWDIYQELCAGDLTCFEPEARGQLVEGLPFHKFYFDLEADRKHSQNTMASPRVRMLGSEAAVIAYVRLVQRLDAADVPQTAAIEETRVWQKIDGRWRHVHFHRAPASK